MANNIVNNYSSTFIQIFNDVIKQYESGLDTIKQTEEELNDIYHEIELGKNQDMYHGYLLYKQVKDLRIKRRQAKEEVELLKDMSELLNIENMNGDENPTQNGTTLQWKAAGNDIYYQGNIQKELPIDCTIKYTKKFFVNSNTHICNIV